MPLALISVYDKTGLVPFAQRLARQGWRFLASGGTAAALRGAGIEPVDVATYTGSPELLGGRVKTLHPAIHAGILARPDAADLEELRAHGFVPIDLVVVNLYPFEETLRKVKERAEASGSAAALGGDSAGAAGGAGDVGSVAAGRAPAAGGPASSGISAEAEIVEQIDIGGVALIRAAAKNYARVCVLCEPGDYGRVAAEAEEGGIQPDTRRELAAKAFALTAAYDAAITAWFKDASGSETSEDASLFAASAAGAAQAAAPGTEFSFAGRIERSLRYGENPHQKAFFVLSGGGRGPLGGRALGGKELSYNNLLDLDAAWRAVLSLEKPAAVIVKHLSPCGAAEGETLRAAYDAALACDPVSAFGGIVALNRPLDADTASALKELFLECVAAPSFGEAARDILKAKKNLRLVEADPLVFARQARELRTAAGGLLVQEPDRGDPPAARWRAVSARQPSAAEMEGLRFAWRVVQHVRSNAIVLAAGHAALGIGGGQTNRVDAVRQACERAGERARGAVMASDAYFPFADGIEAAAEAGVTAVVHPGGSMRDAEVLAAADRLGLAVVYTGVRHFRH
jgi:phosphoribosylaminoimidazolecarboxamide formyltransferase/IMP cyclohydrolase